MKLNPIGSNQTELTTGSHTVLFSYRTPVAYVDHGTGQAYKTAKKWSKTTSKHITRWLQGRTATEVSQDVLDALVA